MSTTTRIKLVMFLFYFIYIPINFFMSPFLIGKGVDIVVAGLLQTLGLVILIVVLLNNGVIADKIKNPKKVLKIIVNIEKSELLSLDKFSEKLDEIDASFWKEGVCQLHIRVSTDESEAIINIVGTFIFLFAIMYYDNVYPLNLILVAIFSGLIGWSIGPTVSALGENFKMRKYKKQFGINYPILNTGVGPSDPLKAEKSLPQLDKIAGYPSTIFIDKKGEVRKIHTGFSGPGTGAFYITHIHSFNKLVDALVAEK